MWSVGRVTRANQEYALVFYVYISMNTNHKTVKQLKKISAGSDLRCRDLPYGKGGESFDVDKELLALYLNACVFKDDPWGLGVV